MQKNYMIRLYRNKPFFIVVIAAFLAVQWSSVHIHLATHHDHDGSHHQHVSKGHLHDLGSHHADAIDVSHADNHESVVELDHECTSPSWKKFDDQPDVLAQFHGCFIRQLYYDVGRPSTYKAPDSSWLSYSTIRLRAPPQFAS